MSERTTIQRKKMSDHTRTQSSFASLINSTIHAGGQPLDSTTRAVMEPRFGHSFADVQMHADSEAHQLAQDVEARAFTTGQHIYFSNGTYDPHSQDGLHLLAHELTHTIQQAAGPVSGRERSDGV